jgi:alkylhydroperoxidase family enzyme
LSDHAIMIELDYYDPPVAVREDLREAHTFLWEHVRSPGYWWSGAERVAMLRAARGAAECRLCCERKAALSPNAVQGTHDSDGTLPENVVEVVHRVRSDPGRLSRAWFEQRIAEGLTDAAYVEIVGVVALSAGVDYFARALGVPFLALPEPKSGSPSGYRPAGAVGGTAWVPMVEPEGAVGPEANLYGNAAFVPNIMKALSLVPDEARALRRSSDAHYVPAEQIPDPSARRVLDRMQMELVASRVSALNQCFY